MSRNATPLQMLVDTRAELNLAEMHLVQAEGCERPLHISLLKIAIQDLHNLRKRAEAAERRIEEELFRRPEEQVYFGGER